VLVVASVSSGAWAQPPVSDTDHIYFVPDTIKLVNIPASDTAWTWAVWVNNKTVLGAIALPVCYTGSASLSLDYTILTPPDIRGVTYGPAGRNAGWQLKASQIDSLQKIILCGFISFTSFPASDDTLLYLHFKLAGGAGPATVVCDSCLWTTFPEQYLSITDVAAIERIPQWNPGVLMLGGTAAGDHGAGITPLVYGLDQNLPNPFNAQTKINFSMPAANHVKLVVFNVLGQEVVTLLDQKLDANRHEVVWDGTDDAGHTVGSGVYWSQLTAGDYSSNKKMVVLK
jgi:hypothetical protein